MNTCFKRMLSRVVLFCDGASRLCMVQRRDLESQAQGRWIRGCLRHQHFCQTQSGACHRQQLQTGRWCHTPPSVRNTFLPKNFSKCFVLDRGAQPPGPPSEGGWLSPPSIPPCYRKKRVGGGCALAAAAAGRASRGGRFCDGGGCGKKS